MREFNVGDVVRISTTCKAGGEYRRLREAKEEGTIVTVETGFIRVEFPSSINSTICYHQELRHVRRV